MEDYGELIYNVFELGRQKDAEALFPAFIEKAFPTFHFRNLALTQLCRDTQSISGKSMNHVFSISRAELDGFPVWAVHCHRVTMGKTPDKHVYLDYTTLGFVGYKDK